MRPPQRVANHRPRRLVGEAIALAAIHTVPRDVLLGWEIHIGRRVERHDIHTAAPRAARVEALPPEVPVPAVSASGLTFVKRLLMRLV